MSVFSSAGIRGPASKGRVPSVEAPAAEGEEQRDGGRKDGGRSVPSGGRRHRSRATSSLGDDESGAVGGVGKSYPPTGLVGAPVFEIF